MRHRSEKNRHSSPVYKSGIITADGLLCTALCTKSSEKASRKKAVGQFELLDLSHESDFTFLDGMTEEDKGQKGVCA